MTHPDPKRADANEVAGRLCNSIKRLDGVSGYSPMCEACCDIRDALLAFAERWGGNDELREPWARCANCGEEFGGFPPRRDPMFCGDKCREEFDKKGERDGS